MQWVGGSYCEDAEFSRMSSPHDIDVWTAFKYPDCLSIDQERKISMLLNTVDAKKNFRKSFNVDAYFCIFDNQPSPFNKQMKWAAYWCGLWSHTRDTNHRKGFCQLSMDPINDNTLLSKL
jgi:hypothetical protein